MLGFEFKGFTELQRGYSSLLFGSILLLHSLNIFREWLNGIVIVAALLFIVYGALKIHLVETIIALIRKESETIDVTPEKKD